MLRGDYSEFGLIIFAIIRACEVVCLLLFVAYTIRCFIAELFGLQFVFASPNRDCLWSRSWVILQSYFDSQVKSYFVCRNQRFPIVLMLGRISTGKQNGGLLAAKLVVLICSCCLTALNVAQCRIACLWLREAVEFLW